jgi:hypothetical protein
MAQTGYSTGVPVAEDMGAVPLGIIEGNAFFQWSTQGDV